MSEFEDYFSEYENKHNCSPEKRECFEAGQQSQQAKIDELQARVDDLTEINRLKTIALQQSVNRTSIHVHEKIVALESKLKGE